MTSNVNVDQGGAVVMVAAGVAERHGVPRDRWIFPTAGSGAHDHWYASNRWAIDESPAMRIAGGQALDLAGVGIDDCRYLDTYSCFPAAVQLAQRELGIAEDRDFTITGGLTFGGGPLNCYCMLSLVRAVHLLRETPDEHAFITGNGGFFTKHSFLVMSGQPSSGYRSARPQDAVDALPAREEATTAPSNAVIEGYSVNIDRDGTPTRSALACLTGDGTRWWASSTERTFAETLMADDLVGASVTCTDDTIALV